MPSLTTAAPSPARETSASPSPWTPSTDKLAPGNSPGIQEYTVGQTWNSFTYQWETNNFTGTTAGTDFDQLGINGALTLTGAAANSYALDMLSLTALNATGIVPNFTETNRQWTILTATGGITGFNAGLLEHPHQRLHQQPDRDRHLLPHLGHQQHLSQLRRRPRTPRRPDRRPRLARPAAPQARLRQKEARNAHSSL